jgi:hypothetical protein
MDDMNFSDYQTRSRATAQYPSIGHPIIYPTLGLANESGKVAGKVKKIFRDKGGVIGDAEREARLRSLPGAVDVPSARVGGPAKLAEQRP